MSAQNLNIHEQNMEKNSKNSGSLIWTLLWIILLIVFVLKFFVYQQVTVVGASMEPNYYTGELLLVNQLDKNYSRGQVVAVYEDIEVAKTADYWTRFKTRFFLKRIIALPGEEVEMVGGEVVIYNSQYPQGRLLIEDYISSSVKEKESLTKYYYPRTKVADKSYFVLGDNRTNSTDSRVRGAFPDYAIFGQENIKIWPTNTIAVFKLPAYQYQVLDQSILNKINQYKKVSPSV